jgi:hypothetical protein
MCTQEIHHPTPHHPTLTKDPPPLLTRSKGEKKINSQSSI